MSIDAKLAKLYRSAPEGSTVYQTLEIHHPVMSAPLRLYAAALEGTRNFKLEASAPRDPAGTIAFTAATFEVSEPSVEKNVGRSVVRVRLGLSALRPVNEILDALEADAIQFLTPIEIIYRVYEGTETLVGPSQDPPIKLYADSVGMSIDQGVTISASTTNNAMRGTGDLYTVAQFPGLVSS